jgi:hypothetical protein
VCPAAKAGALIDSLAMRISRARAKDDDTRTRRFLGRAVSSCTIRREAVEDRAGRDVHLGRQRSLN